MDFELYRFGDDASDLLRSSDKMRVGKVGIARCGPVPPVAENFADQGQVLARHDGLTGRSVPQVVQAQPAEPGIGADRTPAVREAPFAPAFGVAREHERIGVASIL